MKPRWMVTPHFLESYDPALTAAVPEGVEFTLNTVPGMVDCSAANLRRLHRGIARFVQRAARADALPISVAGDCVAALPVMAGLQAAGLAPALVWVDAHGDFNTPETSPSGFLGGMPLAMMVGRGDPAYEANVDLRPVNASDVWLVGARAFDSGEAEALAASKVQRRDVAELGALRLGRPVHLHIDNDVIDAAEVPANNYPVAGGPALQEVIAACEGFMGGNDVRAISFSGWNGGLDRDGKTAAACARLLRACVAARAPR